MNYITLLIKQLYYREYDEIWGFWRKDEKLDHMVFNANITAQQHVEYMSAVMGMTSRVDHGPGETCDYFGYTHKFKAPGGRDVYFRYDPNATELVLPDDNGYRAGSAMVVTVSPKWVAEKLQYPHLPVSVNYDRTQCIVDNYTNVQEHNENGVHYYSFEFKAWCRNITVVCNANTVACSVNPSVAKKKFLDNCLESAMKTLDLDI